MKKAWIENNIVRDVVSGNPFDMFHSDIAVHYDTDVPDGTVQGATLVDGEWVNPVVEQVVEATESKTKVGAIEYKLLFTSLERLAIKTSNDPIIQDLYEITNDPRLTEIDLSLKSTKDSIAYLVSVGVLTQDRAEQILRGDPA